MSGVRRLAACSREYCRCARHSTRRANLEKRTENLYVTYLDPARAGLCCTLTHRSRCGLGHLVYYQLPSASPQTGCVTPPPPQLPPPPQPPAGRGSCSDTPLLKANTSTDNGGRCLLFYIPYDKGSDLRNRKKVPSDLGLGKSEFLLSSAI